MREEKSEQKVKCTRDERKMMSEEETSSKRRKKSLTENRAGFVPSSYHIPPIGAFEALLNPSSVCKHGLLR